MIDNSGVLSDSFLASYSNGVCRCRACCVLAVSTGDGAEAWDTTTDQAPLVMDGVVTLGTGVDLSKVFQLHSNPTATKTIFLDFDGYAINNTPWENGGNLSLRGFYNTLDATALTEIQRIWQRVAEDFSPFNVNVTTQDPGTENLRKVGTGDDRWGIRVAFTSNLNLLTGKAIINAGGGGTAYYDSFNWSTDDVALVFNRGEYTAAETASHEVGHTLNLWHDGFNSTTYYGGHGGTGPTSWGTLMGAPWLGDDENLTQWSKGDYAGANNTQDDLAVITGSNGFSYAADDHGNTFATATTATLNEETSFSSFGVIERNTDVDLFRFDTITGLVSFNVVNASRAYINSNGSFSTEYLASRGPNLDIAATLYRADQSIVQTFNPADLTTASFSINLTAGTYYLGIDGVGFGTPLATTPTGYTDYGSLGQYMVSGTVQSATTPPKNLQAIDPNGNTQLLLDPVTNRVFVKIGDTTTGLIFQGLPLVATQFPGWQILAAEATGQGQNSVLWKELATGGLHTWTVDENWNYVASNGTFAPSSSQGLLLQQQFMVDASGTPLTNPPPPPPNGTLQVLDPNGSVRLLRDTTTDLVSVQINNVTSPVRFQGAQLKATQFAGWQILAAETVGSNQNQILWKELSTGRLHYWSVDSGWNYISSGAIVDPSSTQGQLLQWQFMVDANGTPLTTPPPPLVSQTLDPNGNTLLLRETITDLISVNEQGVIAPLRFQGAQLKANQFDGWQILAAETIGATQKEVLWKQLSTGSLHTWSVDSNWNYLASNGIFAPSSSQGQLWQQQFKVDASGQPLTASAQAFDVIIGCPGLLQDSQAVGLDRCQLPAFSDMTPVFVGPGQDQETVTPLANLDVAGTTSKPITDTLAY